MTGAAASTVQLSALKKSAAATLAISAILLTLSTSARARGAIAGTRGLSKANPKLSRCTQGPELCIGP